MAIYAVGDIQGCYDPLSRLLDTVNFDQSSDMLWCVGDLVNRGPDSLSVLRLLKSLENQCVSVLGNHDIHLLAMSYGIREHKTHDTLMDVLEAPDLPEIISWLRAKPLLYHDPSSQSLLCHAGIYPFWSRKKALSLALEVHTELLEEDRCINLLKEIYSNTPKRWTDELRGTKRLRFIINAFTRMRFCSPKGNLNMNESGFAGMSRKNRRPWFDLSGTTAINEKIIFGHWSALGLLNTESTLCLDTGYVWGRHMTMAKIHKGNFNNKISHKDLFFAAA